jgi:hypothetical protein
MINDPIPTQPPDQEIDDTPDDAEIPQDSDESDDVDSDDTDTE